MKKFIYIFLHVLFPIFLLISYFLIPIYFLEKEILELTKNISIFKIDWSKIPYEITSIIMGVFLSVVTLITIKKINTDKEFLAGDMYGNFCWLIYQLAYLFGLKKISLKSKPYKIIFRILSTKLFDIIDEQPDEKDDINVVFQKKNIKKQDNSQCNIIVGDTYKLNFEQIPKLYEIYDTYEFNRLDSSNKRIYSKKYMDCVGELVTTCRLGKKKINLFLATNIYNTKYLINEYLLVGGRDYINIEIFQQDMKTKKFKEKGYKYIKGEELK